MSKEVEWTDQHPGLFWLCYMTGLIGSLVVDIWFYDHHLAGIYILVGIVMAALWLSIMGTKDHKIAYIYVFLVWPMMVPLTIAWIIKGRPKPPTPEHKVKE